MALHNGRDAVGGGAVTAVSGGEPRAGKARRR